MGVVYPLFVFVKDEHSMRLIEAADRILGPFEAIDIEYDEYAFWDANSEGVSISVAKNKVVSVDHCAPVFPLQHAFALYVEFLGLPAAIVGGTPIETWNRINAELDKRPKKRSLLSKWFSRR
jgi:hypothetical protein